MTRMLKWFCFLVACDLVVSAILLTYAPTQAHKAVSCMTEMVTQ